MQVPVPRTPILDALLAREGARLILIEAPTGSGKSTLLRQIGAGLARRAGSAVVIELSADADWATLARGLLGALAGNVQPGEAQGLGDMAQLAARLEQATRALAAPLHVLIDDFQRIRSPEAITLLTRLIHLEPAPPLTLTIASRVPVGLPVSTLRLRGELAEFGPSALRFSQAEAEALRLGAGVSAPAGAWAGFVQKVNGWAVALRLAVILLREGRIDLDGLLAFSGQQREMAAYLSQLIVEGVAESDRGLLFAAAGFERLRHDVMAAVLGEAAGRRLRNLLRALALPLDGTGERPEDQRLHSLVAEFFEAEAANAGVDLGAIRRRAADYLAGLGEWRRAVSHALRSGNLAAAAGIAERGGGWRLVYRGGDGMSRQFLELARLAPEECLAFPRTILGLAISAAKRGEIDVSLNLMTLAQEAIGPAEADLQAEFRLVSALLDLYSDRLTPPDAVAQLEADITPMAGVDPVRLALTQNLLCFFSLQSARFGAAIRYGRLSVVAFRAAGSDFGAAHLPLHVGQAEFLSGQIENGRATLSGHVARCMAELGPDADLTLMAQVLLAEVDLESGQDGAGFSGFLDRAIEQLGHRDSWFDPLASAIVSRLRIALLAGADADEVLRRAEAIAERRHYTRLVRLTGHLRIEALLGSGQRSEVAELVAAAGAGQAASIPGGDPVNLRGLPLAALEARLCMESGDFGRALHLLAVPLARAEAEGNAPRLVRLGVMRAHVLLGMGDAGAAWTGIRQLALRQRVERLCLPFAEEGAGFASFLRERLAMLDPGSLVARRLAPGLALLDRLRPNPRAHALPAGPAQLTASEADVLVRLERGLSNKEIARSLAISGNTVKFHLANIYRKLDAPSRTVALARARDCGLLVRLQQPESTAAHDG